MNQEEVNMRLMKMRPEYTGPTETPRLDVLERYFYENRPDEWTTNCMRYKLSAEIEAENGRLRKALAKLASWGPDCVPDVCSKEEVEEYNRDHADALAVLDGVDKRSTESRGQSDWLDKAGPLSVYTEIKLPLSDF